MANQRDGRAVEYSCRIYRRLLRVYPRSHRAEYGAAILQLFRDQCRDAWAAQQTPGLIGFWLRALADLLKTSLLEHLSTLNRNRIMPTLFRPTIKPLPAFFGICAAVFLPILFFSVVVTFMLPESYAGSTSILISRPASPGDQHWAQAEVQAISSSAVLDKVSKNLDLPDVWGKKYNNGAPINISDVVALLKSRLDVSPMKSRRGAGTDISRVVSAIDNSDTVLVNIRAYSDNAEEAAKIANSVVEAYRLFRQEEDHQTGAAPIERRVTIMSHASADYRPVRPNKQLNIFIGALAGILIALIVAPLVLGFFAWIKNRRNPPRVPLNV